MMNKMPNKLKIKLILKANQVKLKIRYKTIGNLVNLFLSNRCQKNRVRRKTWNLVHLKHVRHLLKSQINLLHKLNK